MLSVYIHTSGGYTEDPPNNSVRVLILSHYIGFSSSYCFVPEFLSYLFLYRYEKDFLL